MTFQTHTASKNAQHSKKQSRFMSPLQEELQAIEESRRIREQWKQRHQANA